MPLTVSLAISFFVFHKSSSYYQPHPLRSANVHLASSSDPFLIAALNRGDIHGIAT